MSAPTESAVTLPCPRCGADVPLGTSFCPECGADQELAATRERRPLRLPWFLLVSLTLIAAFTTLLVSRYRAMGPAADLATTLRHLVLGDGGRHNAVATLSRAYESSRAVLRYCIDEGVPKDAAGLDWAKVAGYSNAEWRGFVSLIQWAAGADALQDRLAWLLAVDGRDGWGRPWRTTLEPWPLLKQPAGFYPGMMAAGEPPPTGRPLLHLTLASAGSDGDHGTDDDIVFEALFPEPTPLRIAIPEEIDRREFDLERGLVWVRWSGTDADILDSRVLAELLLTAQHGE